MDNTTLHERLVNQALLPGLEETFLAIGERYNQVRKNLGMTAINLDGGNGNGIKRRGRPPGVGLKVAAPVESTANTKTFKKVAAVVDPTVLEERKRLQSERMKKRWADLRKAQKPARRKVVAAPKKVRTTSKKKAGMEVTST